MDGYVLSVERVIPAAPDAIFELVADAAKHPLIDGSGSVKQVQDGAPERLSLGATFGMDMQLGMKYSMVNEVIEFEPNRRIAWQAKPRRGGALVGGRIWRYELEPVDGGTRVRESWDLSQDKQRFLLKRGPVPRQTQGNMEKTLERIEEIVTKE
jgi:uncharacterized protein YndB with AHSA1/START domain